MISPPTNRLGTFKFIFLFTILLFGCKKYGPTFKPEESMQSWLSVNGGMLKDGLVQIKTANGDQIQGILDWDMMREYRFNNLDYTSVPFRFNGNYIVVTGDVDQNLLSFDMVFRKNNYGQYEAALRNTLFNTKLKGSSGKEVVKNIVSYHLLNGDESTVWVSDPDFKNTKKAKRKFDRINTKLNGLQGSKNEACQTYTYTDRWVESYMEGEEVICVIHSYTTEMTICSNMEEEEYDGGDWGGGGGSGGGETSPDELNQLLFDILNAATTSSEIKSVNLTQSDNIERTKVYRWICVTAPSYEIISVETGIHKKVNNIPSSTQWEWKSLTHSGLAMDGFIVGGTLNYSLISATPTMGLYNAIMEVQVQLTASISVFGITLSHSRVLPPSTKVLNVND